MNRILQGNARGSWTALWAASVVTTFVSTCTAQVTVVNLHPDACIQSLGMSVQGGSQAGIATDSGGEPRAALWNGSASSWVSLDPAGATRSEGRGVYGDRQVGSATIGGAKRASLWSGTAGSWIDLSPAGATESSALAISADQQVGYATLAGKRRACMWSGTPESWVDLSPPDCEESYALGVDGGFQVGVATTGTRYTASLWAGSAASWIDLNPEGSWESWAWGVQGGHQVGFARFAFGQMRAGLWSGSAGSWVDLHPGGGSSTAYGVHEGQQVGDVDSHAALWSGSAASWVDLHVFLSADFYESHARSIWHDGSYAYIVGYAYSQTVSLQAILWIVPLCDTDVNCDGALNGFDIQATEEAVNGDYTNFCLPSADINGDGSENGFDIEAEEQRVNGGPC